MKNELIIRIISDEEINEKEEGKSIKKFYEGGVFVIYAKRRRDAFNDDHRVSVLKRAENQFKGGRRALELMDREKEILGQRRRRRRKEGEGGSTRIYPKGLLGSSIIHDIVHYRNDSATGCLFEAH